MADLLSTGISGLLSFQRGLDTTANNIANANTPGFSRRAVDLQELPGQASTFGYIGNGVQVSTIRRVYDEFLTLQLQSTTSGQARLASMDTLAGRVDGLLADAQTGLSPRLQSFFDAVQDLANDPSSPAARQALLGEGENLVSRFRSIDDRLASLDDEVNARLEESVGTVNRLAQSIADINDDIVLAQNRSGQPPNGLLDERDALLRELSAQVSISTVRQDDGAMNVFIGSGQPLVLGKRAEALAVRADEFNPTRMRVAYRTSGGDTPIPEGSVGGALGGLLEFRAQLLDPARNMLGQTALAVALAFNGQHEQGMDLNGDAGKAFFSVEDGLALASRFNAGSGSVNVVPVDVGEVTAADYRLDFDGANYSLTRADTGQSVALTGSGTALDPFLADGLEIVVAGAPAAGDSFLIQPTRGVIADLEVAVSDPRAIAAAAPTRTLLDGNNLGSGTISQSEIVDAADADLLATAVIEFTGPATYSVNGAGSFAYTSGEPIVINGSRFSIRGEPAAGDRFTLEANLGAGGDNRNALGLADLQARGLLAGGSVSLSENYAALVGDVGNRSGQIKGNLEAQTVLLENVEASIAEKSGVNLDEEAANLIRYQQAYEAAAQIIAVTNTLFDTLLAATRR